MAAIRSPLFLTAVICQGSASEQEARPLSKVWYANFLYRRTEKKILVYSDCKSLLAVPDPGVCVTKAQRVRHPECLH
jgi:hypothetical protein